MAFTTGAKALSAEQWRDKGKMTLLATSAHRCALSNVVVAHVDSTGDPAADRKVARHVKKHVDHVVECTLLSSLFWAAVRYVVPPHPDDDGSEDARRPAVRQQTVAFSTVNDALFTAAYEEANSSDLNLMVLAADVHHEKTSFFKHVARAVKTALEPSNERPFPSIMSVAHALSLTRAPIPSYERLQLWGLVYATFANRLWTRVQLLNLPPVRTAVARYVCERLDALAACPGGAVYGLVDLRVQATLAYTAKMEDFAAAGVEADPARLWDTSAQPAQAAGGGGESGLEDAEEEEEEGEGEGEDEEAEVAEDKEEEEEEEE